MQVRKYTAFLVAWFGLLSPHAFGHGEDKPGPHGGAIRMPGAFHTEVVQKDAKTIDVYLLDVAFNNPVVENSSVAGTITQNRKEFALRCSKEPPRFTCVVEGDGELSQGELNLEVSRSGSGAAEVVYELPIQVPRDQSVDADHSSMGH